MQGNENNGNNKTVFLRSHTSADMSSCSISKMYQHSEFNVCIDFYFVFQNLQICRWMKGDLIQD